MTTLTLNILNLEQLQHGVTASHRFDDSGGTLGSMGADWLLIDREQRIQPLHCAIRWAENSFCVIDRCGQTFVNDSLLSLTRGAPVRLREGDYLRVGAYRLRVHYQQEHLHRGSLEQLLEPGRHALDALIADVPASDGLIDMDMPCPITRIDLYEAFGPDIGCDPLAALEATDSRHATYDAPLQCLVKGHTP